MNEIESNNIPTDFSTYTKTCAACGETKSLDYFYKNVKSTDGYSSRCALCYKKNYALNKHIHNAKALKNYYKKQGKPIPEHLNDLSKQAFKSIKPKHYEYNREQLDADIQKRREEKRAHWRAVFAERMDDVLELMRQYEADPGNSVELIEQFHIKVVPKWKLNFGIETIKHHNAVLNGERANW